MSTSCKKRRNQLIESSLVYATVGKAKALKPMWTIYFVMA